MSTEHPTLGTVTREARHDVPTAELVNQGIAMVESGGKRKAAAFLHKNGVGFPVIVRVLNDRDIGSRRAPSKKA
ncbi:hypothetical protein GTP23_13175 [Pseudoduganella sp. FT93W]|uniref:Uncharacterized protein n=1 Tax=Duganella fentianensis TaxID=2692177 RepID=A0A845I2Q4_9BURK|nr:hypothetical protein [Duganella fentianensis]MYN46001.1 hypothetical protein [Duganella fentianensis]